MSYILKSMSQVVTRTPYSFSGGGDLHLTQQSHRSVDGHRSLKSSIWHWSLRSRSHVLVFGLVPCSRLTFYDRGL